MLSRVLLHALFFVLPFVLYGLWLWYERRRARAGEGKPGWRTAPVGWLVIAGLLLVIVSFVGLGIESGFDPSKTYTPPHMKDGELVPGETR
ncbi:MAG: hypothetical protein FJX56_06110 [Alphaproteobacteria bacterium]|nr:hypothetical protein [Alphaproteobacteria bacterium]